MSTPTAASRPANRLTHEASPYLQQHAHNPVDWYPWGSEAFEAARRLNRPIFLSIGYSTCYWCHVMERESFEDVATAAQLNENFICIKVDREERPDVDDVYMTACQMYTQLTTGRAGGGWPLSAFLEPQSLKPFVVGTYFPPHPAHGRPSFRQMLTAISGAWSSQRDNVLRQAEQISELIVEQLKGEATAAAVGVDEITSAVNSLMAVHDRTHGGFGGAPKFPHPPSLQLLIASAWNNTSIRSSVTLTLDRMALGGMYDQLGGGFHRYSVDERWVVPHFEKMLYDQGQLLSVYASAVQETGDPYWSRVIEGVVEFLQREMTSPRGAFYSALDAEVDAQEGLNYLWTAEQMRAALRDAGAEELVEFALSIFGLDDGPNFRDPHHADAPAVNVVILRDRPEQLATLMNISLESFHERLDQVRAILMKVRSMRKQPARDDKILAAWNGLAIAGLADAGRVLKRSEWIAAARRVAADVHTRLHVNGHLHRSERHGRLGPRAVLEDFACLIHGYLALHRAEEIDLAREALATAQALLLEATVKFEEPRGGWYDTEEGRTDLFVRSRSVTDGAVPSGNSLMLLNLLALHEATGRRDYLDQAAATLHAISGVVRRHPSGCALALIGVLTLAARWPELLPTESAEAPATRAPSVALSLALLGRTPKRCDLRLTLRIPDGLHVNAPDPGVAGLTGLTIAADEPDVTLAAQWPRPTRFHGETKAFDGTVEIPVTVESSGPLPKTLTLRVTYQACTDRECLAPERLSLQVELPESAA